MFKPLSMTDWVIFMKKTLIIIASILGVLVVATIGYGYFIYHSVTETVEEMHEIIVRDPKNLKRKEVVNIERKEPLSFLILGIDAEQNNKGRSDTMIVITVNPNTKSLKMLSIPRDTKTTIIGRDFEDKINHSYAFGGMKMTIETVENFLNIPIDHSISINMESFKELVDAFGGVTVHNPFSFSNGGYDFQEGEITLNGDAALSYSRMRYNDPRGDHGRNDRQRQIISSLIKEGAQFSSITKLSKVLEVIGNYVRTDLSFEQMVKIQGNYKDARLNQEQLTVQGTGEVINGIWYYIVPDHEKNRISGILRKHLEIQ